MITFYIVSVIALLLALIAEKKRSGLFFCLSALSLALLCGLRAESVGTDTHTYTASIEAIQSGGMFFEFDIGFYFVVKFISGFTNSIPLTFFLLALITISMIYYTIWFYRNRGSIAFMVFIFMCFLYPQMFNIVRQMLALSIVFAASTLLEKKKPVLFCIILAIASLIHISSLICIGILCIYIIQNIKNKVFIYLSFILFFAALVLSYGTISSLYEARFAYMQDHYQSTLGYEVIAQLLLIGYLILSNYKKIKGNPVFSKISVFCIFSVLLSIVTASAGEASRIAYFYTIFEVLFASVVLRSLPNRKLGYCGFVFLALLNYIFRISVSGWYGITPYIMTSF